MGWLGGFLKRVGGAAPEEMVFAPSVAAPALPGIGEPIVADECYVELFVESLRLTEARRFASRFNGVVYSFVTLAREGDVNAQLAAVSKPDKLTEIDDTSLDKVITVSKQMMAAVPWRGGALSLELGLFSVKAGNLLSPFLDYVTRVSSAAGISFVGAVKPFLPLITEGMDLIAGQRADTAVEVALDTDLALGKSAVLAIVAAPKGSVDVAKLSLDADRRLLLDGRPLDQRLLRVLDSTGGAEGRLRRDSGAEGEVHDAAGSHQGEQGRRCPGRDDGVPARDHRVARSDLLRRAPPGREGAAETGCGVRVDRRRGRARRARRASR